MSDRLQRLREELANRNLDALLVTNILNVRYLSGFTGSSASLLVTNDQLFLITDSRYAEQAAQESPNAVLDISRERWVNRSRQLIHQRGLRQVGFEGRVVNYLDWRDLSAASPAQRFTPTDDLVDHLRLVKDAGELSAIREAVRITDLGYEYIAGILRPGMQEREAALEIDCFMRKEGAEKEAFDTIVASGPRAALPHGKASDRRISEGELVVLDFGAKWQGYHADITRTVLLGSPDPKQAEVYAIVLEAQSRAIAAIRPGLRGGEIDAVARDYIASAGYGEYFGHGLGHGLGLDIHDGRILAQNSDIVLQPGIVVTVEPGIYIPDWGGIRIEDDVVVTESGGEVLTRSPRALGIGG